jgi:hypothetical protein
MSRLVSAAAQRLADLADDCTDDGRWSRGRTLFRKGAVGELSVEDGSVTATVRGSGGDLYSVSVGTAAAPPGVSRQVAQAVESAGSLSLAEVVDRLVDGGVDVCPRHIDLVFDCDCADWEEACKHVVATLLAFADRVDLDEVQVLRWRGLDPTPPAAKPEPDRSTPDRARGEGGDSNGGDGAGNARKRGATEKTAHRTDNGPAADNTTDDDDRAATLTELQALLGDTAVQASVDGDASSLEKVPSTLDPALAQFLGLDEIDRAPALSHPIEVNSLTAPTPLFADVQLGPLVDLGPELAHAITIIQTRLAAEHDDEDRSGPTR